MFVLEQGKSSDKIPRNTLLPGVTEVVIALPVWLQHWAPGDVGSPMETSPGLSKPWNKEKKTHNHDHFWVIISKLEMGQDHFFSLFQCLGNPVEASIGFPGCPRAARGKEIEAAAISGDPWDGVTPSALPSPLKAKEQRLPCWGITKFENIWLA